MEATIHILCSNTVFVCCLHFGEKIINEISKIKHKQQGVINICGCS